MSKNGPGTGSALPSPHTLAIHLDLVGGLAGDMFVAALVDALPALEAPVLAALAAVQPGTGLRPRFEATVSGGLRAYRLVLEAPVAGIASAAHAATSYPSLRRLLGEAALPVATRDHAVGLLELLGAAEAEAHGIPIDAVHFHELADWDSLLDLVAAGEIAARLEGALWFASDLPLGGGSVRTAHGLLPVPAPATSWLLRGYPWRDDGVAGERVTPTGAAILRHLVPAAACTGRREAGRLAAVGCGAGSRQVPGLPNVTRALVFERDAGGSENSVAVLEFEIDDMSGEEVALAADRLRAQSGVVDVSVGSRIGKKGRPVTDFRVLAQPQAGEAVAQACFAETSTLGLRLREERRRVLRRTEVPGRSGGPRVKVAERPGGERTAKAEHDDVAEASSLSEQRRLRSAGERAALEGDNA